MPYLHIFTACEKVILDDGVITSLIALFGKINVATTPEPLPPNAAIPMNWAIYTSWEREPDDGQREFVQYLKVVYPDGSVFVEIPPATFKFGVNKKHQIKSPLLGFPVGQEGEYSIHLRLEHDGQVIYEPKPIHLEVDHNSQPNA